ncbi:MAG: prepilin-type N-terminal cleavage/methylation domain-containing protein [Phycisphaerales bacterium]
MTCGHFSSDRRASRRFGEATCSRAFTLIEVLIGILVLALGLLGLGAVIPVVVREQRLATDATLGVAVAQHAEGVLRARPTLDPDAPPTTQTLWDALVHDPNWSRDLLWDNFPTSSYSRQAQIIYSATRRDVFQAIEYDFNLQTGQLRWRQTIDEQDRSGCTGQWMSKFLQRPLTPKWDAIDLGERLWPNKGAQTSRILPANADPNRPQFVWDVVARRAKFGSRSLAPFLPAGNLSACYYPQVNSCPPFNNPQPPIRLCDQPDEVQVALFVRRIDLNIKSPKRPISARQPTTLYDLLTGAPGVPAVDRRLPVAVDPVTKRPTGNGIGDYSTPEVLNVRLSKTGLNQINRSRLILDSRSPGATNLLPLASQIGQKLVDNLGNVYTCRGVVEPSGGPVIGSAAGDREIEIDPPIPQWVPALDRIDVPPGGANAPEPLIYQVVFTPQIPAAVRVFTITRPVWAR